MTHGFRLKSLNQEPQIAKLLAKLPDRRRAHVLEHEESAAATYQECECAQHVAVGVRNVAATGKFGDRFAESIGVHSGEHSYNWEGQPE